jgi:hypothetical protein
MGTKTPFEEALKKGTKGFSHRHSSPRSEESKTLRFANFISSMSAATHYAFTVGKTRFVAMNAFDVPDPGSFAVLPKPYRLGLKGWLRKKSNMVEVQVSGQRRW